MRQWRLTALAAAALVAGTAAGAESVGWADLPREMVLMQPPDAVAQGLVVWRAVHATVTPGAQETRIDLRFVGPLMPDSAMIAAGWLAECATDPAGPPEGCVPNALGKLVITLTNDPDPLFVAADRRAEITLGGTGTIDRGDLDLIYMVEVLGALMGHDLQLTEDGADIVMRSEGWPDSLRWRPMALADLGRIVAASTAYQQSLSKVGTCIIGHFTDPDFQPSPELLAWQREDWNRNLARLPVALGDTGKVATRVYEVSAQRYPTQVLMAREEVVPQTVEAVLAMRNQEQVAARYGTDFITRDFDSLRLAAQYEQRIERHRAGGADLAERLCADPNLP